MVKTCIATCVKDETEYIEDFIKYHLDIGIDEIFIYEDYGSVSHKEICDKYDNVYLSSILDIFPDEQREEIIQMRIDKVPSQTLYINQILKYLHPTHNEGWWVFLTDIDEFITCTEKFPDIMDRYKDFDSVLIYWKNYGSNNHIYKPVYDKPIYEIYTKPCQYEQFSDAKHWKITKFIVNMNKWKPSQKYFIHCASVNFVKADMTYKRTEPVFEPLYLRHYILKSAEEYLWKIFCRGMHHPSHRNLQSLREMDDEIYEKLKNEKGFREYFKEKYNVELPPLD